MIFKFNVSYLSLIHIIRLQKKRIKNIYKQMYVLYNKYERWDIMKKISKGKYLNHCVYKSPDIIMKQIKDNPSKNKCIIIGDGHSLSVDENDYIINHDPIMSEISLLKKIDYTSYVFYFPFECSGLESASKEIVNFVNSLSPNYEEIILIGHSKCGLCLANASSCINRKVTLFTISTPYLGTIIADRKKMESVISNSYFIKIYNKIFSDHNVDKDIIPNSDFIQHMSIPYCSKHINIISTVSKISKCSNLLDIVLYFIDKKWKINGDGIVPYESQKTEFATEIIEINCSHATSLKKGIKIIEKFLV